MRRMEPLPLRAVLARVSRSFYLSLWLLPAPTRETTALAYLLARAADTVADTRIVAPEERLRLLGQLKEVVATQGTGAASAQFVGEVTTLWLLFSDLGRAIGFVDFGSHLDSRIVAGQRD